MRISRVMPVIVSLVAMGASRGAAQLAPAPGRQYVTVTATAASSRVPVGGATQLWAEVTPNAAIHVYAAGAVDFKPVTLVVTPNARIVAGRPTYPMPDVATAPGSTGRVPAYAKPFRIALPITVAAAAQPGERLTIAGAVTYQACDDRMCYPPSALPVTWTVTVASRR